jgi:Mitochondrial mRNA-processing protein COX24, C-terminal
MAGSMRELCGDSRRQVIKSGTSVTSREREVTKVGSVIKKRRKRMAKKKHRKLLKRTRIQRRRAGK